MSENWQSNLLFHHVGCITKSLEKSKAIYQNQLGFLNFSETFVISKQDVKVCFIETAPGVYLELVEPTGINPFLRQILKNKNPFYHIGFTTNNFEETLQDLLNKKFYLVNRFLSEAFNKRQCAFLYTSDMQLIEIIENPRIALN